MSVQADLQSTLSRRERERLMRRNEILQAARAVFAEKGYAQATLDEIAQRAEFGKGTLYNYFEGGKEEILFAVFDELYGEFSDLIRNAFAPERTAGRPFRVVFEAFVASCMHFFLERRDLFMILIKEAHRLCFSDDQEKAAYFVKQRERLVNALIPALEQATASGELRPLPAEAVAHLILGNINGMQVHMSLAGAEEKDCEESVINSPEAAARFLTTMLCDGLLAQPQSYPTEETVRNQA